MPRPEPKVSLHGAVNFDKLVPFDSAPNAPPLANNDILVMRKAAGGDNLTVSIGDINATGSVNIAQLIGGANDDMLFRVLGVWTGTGPSGLSYNGTVLGLDGNNIQLNNGATLAVEDAGNIELNGTGNIEQSGTGDIEINGGGALMISNNAGDAIEIADGGSIKIAGVGAGGILLEGSGNIQAGTGQILAALGTQALPGFAFAGDPDTGIFGFGSGQVIFTTNGVQQFIVTPGSFSGTVGSAPILRNLAASATVPNIVISSTDVNTGLGTAGADILSLIAGAVEIARATEVLGSEQFAIIANGNTGVPDLTSLGDPDTGWHWTGANIMAWIGGGSRAWNFSTAQFFSQFSNGPALINAAAGPAAINIRVDRSDSGTGFSTDSTVLGIHAANNLIATADGPADALILQGAGGLRAAGGGGAGPEIRNVGASATVPTLIPNQADLDTGYTRSGVNQASVVCGGVEAIRFRSTTATIAANSNLLIFDYDDTILKFVQFGADDSGGAGFKMCRVIN